MPRLEKEIWIARFAEILCHLQPHLPVSTGREVAEAIYPEMCMLTPKGGVQTLISMLAQTPAGSDALRWA